ncbi:MAG: hypothetical protein DWQ02_27030, partial [Bacteroidetes bacterium]
MDQKHHGQGDNVARDKIENIGTKIVQYESKREVPRLLTKLPSLSDKIIGREEELSSLFDTLETSQRVVLMNGMGGIGKTTVATAFANRHRDKYTHIAWVEQLGDFSNDLGSNKVLAQNLGIPLSGDPTSDAQIILNAMSNLGGKSLLVLDNGDEQLQQFKDYFPKAPDWHVLITSRQEMSFAKKVALDFLNEKEALNLFYSHYDLDEDDETASEILRTVDFHTLTIEVFAKTAQNLEITPLRKLRDLLEQRGVKIGKPVDFSAITHSKEDQIKQLFPYLEAIFQLPDMSEDEVFLLKQYIGLPPIFLSWDMITSLLDIKDEDESVWDSNLMARNSLRKKGWIIYDEEQQAFKMHRIIQDVLVDKLKPEFEDLETLVNNITDLLYLDEVKENPVDKFQFIPFGVRILQVFPDHEHEDFAVFVSNLAVVYRNLGEYEKARDLHQKVLELDIRNYGEDHPSTARSRSNLAVVYQNLGDYEGAHSLLEKALESDIRNYGEDHPSTAIRRSNLALVYQDLGDYEGARSLLEKVL